MRDQKLLYLKVREHVLKRIHKGDWQPGEVIPNEFEIAAECGVSQGTARKAIGELATDGILTRQQGRGTFVTEHTSSHAHARFPGLVTGRNQRLELGCLPPVCTIGAATREECSALDLEKGARVQRIYRLRILESAAVMSEAITLPARIFKTMKATQVTDTLYDLFQRSYGVHVVHITDKLSAIAADKKRARELHVEVGTPLLKIDRIALALDRQKVEWRVTLCHPDGIHYLSTSS